MPFLVRTPDNGATYSADTIHRRWIKTSPELTTVKEAYAAMGWDATVHIIENLDGAGVLVGDPPPAAQFDYDDPDPPEGHPGRGEDDGWRRRHDEPMG